MDVQSFLYEEDEITILPLNVKQRKFTSFNGKRNENYD